MSRWLIIAVATLLWFGCATPKNTFVYYKVRVQPGDTLSQIAQRFDADWQQMTIDNKIADAKSIKVGSVLIVRPGRSYLKRMGVGAMPKGTHVTQFETPSTGISSGILNAPTSGSISSHFGPRGGRQHRGIDIRANRGTPIRAVDHGRVTFSGWKRGYGKTIVITHDASGFSTLYAHCDRLYVSEGDRVHLGATVATVGRTGNATGYHLHFELRNRNNQAVNPMPWLRNTRLARR